MSKDCIYIFKHNIYVQIAMYTFKLQSIRPQFTKYICPSRCMEFRFILPRLNVIFDIYITCAASTYISACKRMQMN